jgi:hypothetical protein
LTTSMRGSTLRELARYVSGSFGGRTHYARNQT